MIDLFCKSATLLTWIFSLFFSRQGEGKRARDGKDKANVRKDRSRRLKAFKSEKGQNGVVKDTKRSPKSKHKLKVLNIIACLLGSDAPPFHLFETWSWIPFFPFFFFQQQTKTKSLFFGFDKRRNCEHTEFELTPRTYWFISTEIVDCPRW